MSKNIRVADRHVNCYFASTINDSGRDCTCGRSQQGPGFPANSRPALRPPAVGLRRMTRRARFDFPSFYAALSATVGTRRSAKASLSRMTPDLEALSPSERRQTRRLPSYHACPDGADVDDRPPARRRFLPSLLPFPARRPGRRKPGSIPFFLISLSISTSLSAYPVITHTHYM